MTLGERIKQKIRKKNVIFSLIGIFLAMALISFTVGKDLLSGKEPSLISFAIINFAGYLFFLLLPLETLIPYYIAYGYNGVTLIIIVMAVAMVAQVINFAVGYLMSGEIIHDLVGKTKFEKLHRYIEKYGAWAIFLFNLFPLASSVLSLVAGMARYSLKKLLFYSFLGLLIKYILLVYFSDKIFF
ncbi:MAG TPA: VTT domain-containing protein [Candidatus Nanoarchaeia archaeon]|nr:VTT domain-containing protein [Candidatus Nanoarchaeia archaeon]